MSGFVNINKNSGPTSHDIVSKIRGFIGREMKVGHLGTLDPIAEGVLPVAIGSATRTFQYFLELRKSYLVTMVFGKVTDTQDITGKILEENPSPLLSMHESQSFLDKFLGETLQSPPMFSALSVGGKKLYELAREGIEVDRKKRRIEVFSIQADSVSGPYLKFKIECSRGTYIRTFCHDLGKLYGCGACMVSLIRTGLGPFDLSDSLSLNDFQIFFESGSISKILVSLADALNHFPAMYFSDKDEAKLRKGISLDCLQNSANFSGEEIFRMLASDGKLIGMGKIVLGIPGSFENIKIRPTKIFN